MPTTPPGCDDPQLDWAAQGTNVQCKGEATGACGRYRERLFGWTLIIQSIACVLRILGCSVVARLAVATREAGNDGDARSHSPAGSPVSACHAPDSQAVAALQGRALVAVVERAHRNFDCAL